MSSLHTLSLSPFPLEHRLRCSGERPKRRKRWCAWGRYVVIFLLNHSATTGTTHWDLDREQTTQTTFDISTESSETITNKGKRPEIARSVVSNTFFRVKPYRKRGQVRRADRPNRDQKRTRWRTGEGDRKRAQERQGNKDKEQATTPKRRGGTRQRNQPRGKRSAMCANRQPNAALKTADTNSRHRPAPSTLKSAAQALVWDCVH